MTVTALVSQLPHERGQRPADQTRSGHGPAEVDGQGKESAGQRHHDTENHEIED